MAHQIFQFVSEHSTAIYITAVATVAVVYGLLTGASLFQPWDQQRH